MTSRLMKRHLSLCLVLVMLLTAMLPVSVFAAGSNDEGSAASGGNAAATTMISDYATFLSCFKVLEGYAQTYAEENAGEDANALIINYIRTGVERYTSGTWEMVCGKENTAHYRWDRLLWQRCAAPLPDHRHCRDPHSLTG